jgi:hypothetical protein
MIPKILHYCWFGGNSYPPIVEKCINGWQEKLPDYKIIKWDETNVPIASFQFMKEAYQQKKYAFVSDHARYWVLSQYGGVFLDTDVEIIKSFNPLLSSDSCFFGFAKHVKKNVYYVNPGLIIGSTKNNNFIREVLEHYNSISFLDESGNPDLNKTSPVILTDLLMSRGLHIQDEIQTLTDDITIYPTEYFDPINPRSIISKQIKITNQTYAIHHGAASWVPRKDKLKRIISILCRNILGDLLVNKLRKK